MHSSFQQILAVSCLAILLLADSGTAAETTSETTVTIEPFSEELYRFTNPEGNSGVMLITSPGAIIGDPLGETAARALSARLAAEFETTVKYVFYTRADVSRAGGTKVFADTGALVIAHANALQSTAVIDGLVSSPDLVFTDSMSVRLGDQSVTLQHLGNNLSDDLLVARFAWQKVLFAADIVGIESLPALTPEMNLGMDVDSGFYPDWFLSIDRLSKLDFLYLLDGQGKTGNRNDAKQHEYYLRELYNRVRRAVDAGQTEEEMIETIKMAKYRDWNHYDDALPGNIRSMHRALQNKR